MYLFPTGCVSKRNEFRGKALDGSARNLGCGGVS